MKKKITQVLVGFVVLFIVVTNAVEGQWSVLGNYPVNGAQDSVFNFYINSLTTDNSGNLYAGGLFNKGKGKNYLAKWNGKVWSELGGKNVSTFKSDINSLTTDASGNLYAAGNFYNNIGMHYVA